MCGIAGYFSNEGIDHNILNKMCGSLFHRGPDDKGTWYDNQIGFAHTRLSILDLSENGKQPMISNSGRFVLIFNGEIYNHLDLRKLIHKDWKGSSDTETLLECLEKLGIEKTLNNLEGMFAFALYDRTSKTITLVRDHMGQKPLYYGWINNKFIFASELSIFKIVNNENLEVDRDSLSIFIKTGYVPAPKSIYRNIHKLKPGCSATIKLNNSKTINTKEFFALRELISKRKNQIYKNDIIENKYLLKKTLLQSVSKQQLSDVPVGAFLSGGIDSSLISCLMQENSNKKIDTFTIAFEDKRFDESKFAKQVASIISSNHHELKITHNEILQTISLIPKIYDEPFADSSQLVTFLLSKFAKNDVSVALSGDGGDELFAGYNRYKWTSRILNIPYPLRKSISTFLNVLPANALVNIENIGVRLGAIENNFQFSDKLGKLAYLLNKKNFEDLYQNLLFNYIDNTDDNPVLGTNENNSLIAGHEIPSSIKKINEKMMYYDSLIYLPDDILCKVDRASMAVSLETRVPFLDQDVIKLSWELPMSQKINNGKSKYILRKILEDYIPKDLIERPKMGFAVPLSSWLRGPLKEYADQKILSAINNKDKYFDSKIVLKKWHEHLEGKKNWHYFIWNVIVFQSWVEYNNL